MLETAEFNFLRLPETSVYIFDYRAVEDRHPAIANNFAQDAEASLPGLQFVVHLR